MGKTAYGEFTFNKPTERASMPGYAHGGKVDAPTPMKKGGKAKAKAAPKGVMKKEVAMLRKVEMPETMAAPMSPLASAAQPPMAPSGMMKKGGKVEGSKADMEQDKAMIKKAFKQHDSQEHKGGKGTTLKLKKGGVPTHNRSPKVC